MGRIFKTPTDDSTEATLRAMHTQNTLDTYYEKGIGWVRTVFIGFIAVLITSYWELNSDESIWTNTVEWVWSKVQNLADWIWGGLNG
jgi:hypothetical protein|tara:strand:+ start:115 stop:375 length:261 start_codon:yes stop_codon:yes gene_type:complete